MQPQNEDNIAVCCQMLAMRRSLRTKMTGQHEDTFCVMYKFFRLYSEDIKTASLRPQTKLTRLLWVWNKVTNLLEFVHCRVRWNILADMYELPIGLYVLSVVYITLTTILRECLSSISGVLFCWIFNSNETSVAIEDSRKPECKAFCGKKKPKAFCKIR